jgi:hypothetical protein
MTNREIVAVLKPGSEMLANLQQGFQTMVEDRRRNQGKWIDIFCFYEELSYPGIGEVCIHHATLLRAHLRNPRPDLQGLLLDPNIFPLNLYSITETVGKQRRLLEPRC